MSPAAPAYSDAVRALFRDLPGAGDVAAGDVAAGGGLVGSGEAVALDRGAWVRFTARVEGGRFAEVRFRAFGCPHTLAAASWVTRRLGGAPLAAAAAVEAGSLASELGVPAEKMGRMLVVEDALRALLADLGRVE